MENFNLECPLFYENGVTAYELKEGQKPIAIKVENSLVGLHNFPKSVYQSAENACLRQQFAGGRYQGYLPTVEEFLLWVRFQEQFNRTVEFLRAHDVPADFLSVGNTYWTAHKGDSYSTVVNMATGCCLLQNKSCLYFARPAIGIS